MTALLEIREKIKEFYSRFEVYLLPVVKFALAFIVLMMINSRMSYMARLDSVPIVLIVALMCSFLPTGCIVFFAAIFTLGHLYGLGMEAALVVLCVYLVLFLLFFRFSPKETLLVVLTPVLFALKLPYVVPIAAGLLLAPSSMVSACSGVVIYYVLHTILSGASNLMTMGDDILAKIRFLLDGIVGNKAMIVVAGAFAVTILVVYLIRRMSVDYAWTIAMITGAILNIVVILVGDLIFDINVSAGGVILGSILAIVIGKGIEFFRFCVDYSRTEKVQFEDDEYYYYVKAVPKMTVAAPTKTVKRINTQTPGRDRRVETERTGRRSAGTAEYGRSGRSVTIGSTRTQEPAAEYGYEDGYEEGYEGEYETEGAYTEDGYGAEGEYDPGEGYDGEDGYGSEDGYYDEDETT